ncbi:MAG: FCD domain-containing protein [Planctomycetota bacterium]
MSGETWSELQKCRAALEINNLRRLLSSQVDCGDAVINLRPHFTQMQTALETRSAAAFFRADIRFHLKLAYRSLPCFQALKSLLLFIRVAAQRMSNERSMRELLDDHQQLFELISKASNANCSESERQATAAEAEKFLKHHIKHSTDLFVSTANGEEGSISDVRLGNFQENP